MAGLVSAPSILVVGPIFPLLRAPLESLGGVADAPLPFSLSTCSAPLLDAAPRIRAAVTTSEGGFPRPLFDLLPALQLIANFGVGVDSIDVAEAKRRGIVVTNTPGVLTDDVADLAVGLIVAAARQLCAADRFVRRRRWPTGEKLPLTMKVSGKRVGVLGLGRIGLAAAQRLAAFRCPVAYCNRRPRADAPFPFFPSAEELAAASDVLLVACPLTEETRGLVGRRVLDALGPQGLLVNIARGAVVDEAELVRALQEMRIAGAGLDVFAEEPHVPEELLGMENVVLLPHIGTDTVETSEDMAKLVVENLEAVLSGRRPITPV